MIPGEDDRRGRTESSVTDNKVTFKTFKSGLCADLKQQQPEGKTRDVFTLCFCKKMKNTRPRRTTY